MQPSYSDPPSKRVFPSDAFGGRGWGREVGGGGGGKKKTKKEKISKCVSKIISTA